MRNVKEISHFTWWDVALWQYIKLNYWTGTMCCFTSWPLHGRHASCLTLWKIPWESLLFGQVEWWHTHLAHNSISIMILLTRFFNSECEVSYGQTVKVLNWELTYSNNHKLAIVYDSQNSILTKANVCLKLLDFKMIMNANLQGSKRRKSYKTFSGRLNCSFYGNRTLKLLCMKRLWKCLSNLE